MIIKSINMGTFKLTILLILFFSTNLFCQSTTTHQQKFKDSLQAKLISDSTYIYRFQKLRPFFNIDQRNSFIRNSAINVNGIQIGVLIKEKHIIGFGAYSITSNSKQNVKTKTYKNIETFRNLDMKYITLFYQYIAIDKKYFELNVQAEIGGGLFNLKFYDAKSNNLLFEKSSGLIVTGIGPLIAIKPIKWIGITGMAGYRFTFEKSPNLNFNGAYYSYGVWLDIRQIIRDVNYYFFKKRKYKNQLVCVAT
jgi:hypothetical protein